MVIFVHHLFILLLTTVISFLLHRVSRLRRFRLPPGNLGLPFIGETLQLISAFKTENPEPFIDERVKRYGSVFTTHIFGEPTVFSAGPETNRFILQNEGKLFESSYPGSISNLLGKHSLLLMRGNLHKRMHSLTMSFASSSIIKDQLLVDIDRLIRLKLDSWTDRVFLMEETKKIEYEKIMEKKSESEALQWSDYKSMSFTQCVINQTLRVANIISGVFRRTITEVNINGYTIPKDRNLFVSFRAVHLDHDNLKTLILSIHGDGRMSLGQSVPEFFTHRSEEDLGCARDMSLLE
ncbi:Cytochrome P450 90A1 [Hibiscus syriacus]|uniref:Cytochrome P450 90A1 n=1 Tax=Hibiscus syriacus TaxID=106335 RepID=A0A6A2ZDM3_HIBSY|nr:Cytochrome P450 90A1 [Hibiscus syriacus]